MARGLVVASAVIAFIRPSTIFAQPVGQTVASLEWRCLQCRSIVVGTIADFQILSGQGQEQYTPEFEFTIAVHETLKGPRTRTAVFRHAWDRRSIDVLEKARREKAPFVFLIDKSRPHARLLPEPWPASFPTATADYRFRFWSGGEQYSLARPAFVRKLRQVVAENAKFGTSMSFQFRYGHFLSVVLPLDQRAEHLAQLILGGKDPNTGPIMYGGGSEGPSAVRLLSHFRSAENEELVRSMLKDSRQQWVRTNIERVGDRFRVQKSYPVRAEAFRVLSEWGVEAPEPVSNTTTDGPQVAEGERATVAALDAMRVDIEFTRPVQDRVRVRKIEFRNCRKIPPLEALSRLREVHVVASGAVDISHIGSARALEEFHLYGAKIEGLQSFFKLERLTVLRVPRSGFSDLKPLTNLTNLQTLDISGSRVQSLKPLSGLKKLQSLNVSSTRVEDLRPLKGLTNLNSLVAAHSRIRDLTPLTGLTQLAGFFAEKSRIDDLRPLANHAKLQAVDVSGTQVSNLEPLASCKSLRSVSFARTRVRSLDPLAELPLLTTVTAAHCRIEDVSVLAGLTSLRQLDVRGVSNLRGARLLRERLPKLSLWIDR